MTSCTRLFVVGLGLLAVGSTASATDVTGALTFVGITPCRIIETRNGQGFSGVNGPPALVANTTRAFQITGTVPGLPLQCGIPDTALAISVNFVVVNFAGAGDIRAFPSGGSLPVAAVLNYALETIGNANTIPLGPSGGGHNGITVQADVSGTDFIADVNGYYVPRPLTTLESGRTLKGQWSCTGAATAGGQYFSSAVTFEPPLAAAITVPVADFIAAGTASTTNCPGSAANPQAARGHFCMYEVLANNRTFFCALNGATNVCNQADPEGTGVWVLSAAAGTIYSFGTWAVTAP